MKKVVIVNFTMPPYKGIGGRRWAKFTKYLHVAGIEVSVIAAKRRDVGNTPWQNDIKTYSDKIIYVDPKHPKILASVPKNIFEKILYKWNLEMVKIRYGKYNYFDPSTGFGTKILPIIENKILEGFNNVIVSCGPFHMAHEIIQLKHKYPNVNFIADFRDPWANNSTTFGFTAIGNSRLNEEKRIEKEAVCLYDSVISVSDEMGTYFKNISGQDKFITIPNGFDSQDFNTDLQPVTKMDQHFNFVFTGTLYEKTRHLMEELVEILSQMRISHSEIYSNIRFQFYGKIPVWFYEVTQSCRDVFSYGGEIELSEVYERICAADVCCLFLTDDLLYSRSTKFYEYLVAHKPIAVFSKEGGTARFVEENQLGYACVSGKMQGVLQDMFADREQDKLVKNFDFDISDWDVKQLTEKIISLLK